MFQVISSVVYVPLEAVVVAVHFVAVLLSTCDVFSCYGCDNEHSSVGQMSVVRLNSNMVFSKM